MKKLILPLILLSFSALAAQEMSDASIRNKFLSVVKDNSVENSIVKSPEFSDCRKFNEFKAGEDQATKDAKLQKATSCFRDKIGKQDSAAITKLADNLKLQEYGLIKSKNVNDITEYLTNKMTKSLTGRDPSEKDPKKYFEQMNWKNHKTVDHKVFIDLYTNQLMKNALFEVSRYCFENLRVKSKSTVDNFADHWSVENMEAGIASPTGILRLTDNGTPPFFKLDPKIDTTDKAEVYKGIVSGLSNGSSEIDPKQYEKFFTYCQTALPLMCDRFKTETASKAGDSAVDLKKFDKDSKMDDGGSACLVMDKLRAIRTAMANTEKVAKQFEEMGDGKNAYALQMISGQVYQRGHGANEESLDELTTVSSADMLANSKNQDLSALEEECRNGSNSTQCNDYLIENNGLEKAINNVETEMNLKRELEMARVKAMKPQELKDYLKENGLFDLLNELESGQLAADQISSKVGEVYDARKLATIEGLKIKVGKRQVSASENLSDAQKNEYKAENVKDSNQERARLAQVVMFNNIITSQLNLVDKATGKSAGRNVTAWKKEMKGLSGSGGYQDSDQLFQGLQDVAKKEGSQMKDASVVGGGIIDAILGKKP